MEDIFTEDVYDKICLMAGQPHRSIVGAACKYVIQKARDKYDMEDPTVSAVELLRHFGIKQRGGNFGSTLVRWLGRLLRRSTPPKVDHVKNIKTLADVFCEQNPDGGAGYSFGALLERYVAFHLIYYHEFAKIHAIGGERRGYIANPDGHDIQENCPVRDENYERVASVTLHWLLGASLIRRGQEPVNIRVSKNLRGLGDFNDGSNLCHGTTVASATNILAGGVELERSVKFADFGQGFYLTDSFEYAVHAACEASVGELESAVVVFPVPREHLVGSSVLDLDFGDAWQQIVAWGSKQKTIKDKQTKDAYRASPCIAGPISSNAQKVCADSRSTPSLAYTQTMGIQRSNVC